MGVRGPLDEHLVATFVGRHDELDFLAEVLNEDGPVVTFVHGIPGAGTSALLERFAVDAREHGAAIVAIDCRAMEPTPGAVRAALSDAGALEDRTSGRRTVVLLDHWSSFRLLDAWFRLELVPALPASTALLVADDRPPSPAWRASPRAKAAVRERHLDVLPREDALALLEQEEITGDEAERILARTRGLPLALQLAASSGGARPFPAADVDVTRVAAIWGEAHLASLRPHLRHALEAISVARRGTAALVQATVPGARADLLDELATLPFVQVEEDGLAVHPAVRPAIVAGLRSVDPQRYLDYRRAAWEVAAPSLERVGRRRGAARRQGGRRGRRSAAPARANEPRERADPRRAHRRRGARAPSS